MLSTHASNNVCPQNESNKNQYPQLNERVTALNITVNPAFRLSTASPRVETTISLTYLVVVSLNVG